MHCCAARTPLAIALACLFSTPVLAQDPATPVATVVVEGSRPTGLGVADTASTGVVSQKQLEARTVYRPGELLEATPGLIVSQHSGEGKANQFYLRGLNLDHGTDLRTTIDGMLVNQRSHAHGQGWTDLNFMIPELASSLDYAKGPYSAEQGDFAAAGAVSVNYVNTLAQGIAAAGIGQNGYARTLLADSPKLGNGNLLYALELFRNDGPFIHPDGFRKINALVRYSDGSDTNGFNVTLMGYKAHWNASDQIAQRAIDSGLLQNRFDTIDPTDGGKAHRYSLSAAWSRSGDDASTKANVYIVGNQLDLYSNFTYFLDHPATGDQFNQPDRRITLGFNASHWWRGTLFNRPSETTVGVQLQSDNIHNGLHDTQSRVRLATTREDHVRQRSAGVYVQNAITWAPWFRSVLGVREDYYHNDVASQLALNSGTASAHQASPKLSLVFGPWNKTEYYVSLGRGFHSNDARGTTIRVDPKNPDMPATREAPIVPARGLELGVRSELVRGLQTSLALYRLDYNSELLFAGDAGSTADTGRPSRRTGVELSNYYKLATWLTVDGDIAYARTRYRDADPAGAYIPGSVEGVASLALTVDNIGPWFGAVQLRYFGPRPLIEDNSVRSKATSTINARVGYKFSPRLRLAVEIYNVTGRRDSAIDYAYRSRLPGEAAEGKFDVHFHPIESRSLRANLIANF
ncbi:TonB-dependent receptor [Massilia psychrophila]|uniref:TonB-dependent receptor n=2 Tax=Massilia psychrophila TaxID=1603353 RepID=A0A2G8T3L2_9BURK|nr:TonB-dependent receptor [Massilia psychrophila]